MTSFVSVTRDTWHRTSSNLATPPLTSSPFLTILLLFCFAKKQWMEKSHFTSIHFHFHSTESASLFLIGSTFVITSTPHPLVRVIPIISLLLKGVLIKTLILTFHVRIIITFLWILPMPLNPLVHPNILCHHLL
jgi:hypothetical protein